MSLLGRGGRAPALCVGGVEAVAVHLHARPNRPLVLPAGPVRRAGRARSRVRGRIRRRRVVSGVGLQRGWINRQTIEDERDSESKERESTDSLKAILKPSHHVIKSIQN